MQISFDEALTRLSGQRVLVCGSNYYPEKPGKSSLIITFEDGTRLRADFWRLMQGRTRIVTGFDHQQQYGLVAPIDSAELAGDFLSHKVVSEVMFIRETCDLCLLFEQETKLQIFNFTGYEVWELSFPNGQVEYSNQIS